jgi:hypothetical protein
MGSTPSQVARDGAEAFSLVIEQAIQAIAAAAG